MPDGVECLNMAATMPEHPKILRVGGDAAWLWFCALAYCKRLKTDGVIEASALPRVSDRRQPMKLVARLVQERMMHGSAHDCKECVQPMPGSYVMHDYLYWQGTAAGETATREAKEHGGAYGNHRRWHVSRDLADPSCQFCTTSLIRSESESLERSHMRSESDSSSDRSPNRTPNRTTDGSDEEQPPLPPQTPPSPRVDIPPPTPPAPKAKRTRRQAYDYASDPEFLRFWDVFPEKSGKSAAFSAWLAARARGAAAEDIIAAAERYRDNPHRDPNKTKYPQGWLNDERYLDGQKQGETGAGPRRITYPETPWGNR